MLIAGPRQAGKTTLARQVGEAGRRLFVTLDDLGTLATARSDPQGFIQDLPTPVTIDEIQRAPELLLAIKRRVDEKQRPGTFLLTGSSDPMAVRSVKETLAGRMAIEVLRPLTWSERQNRPDWNPVDTLSQCRSARDAAESFAVGGGTDLARLVPLGGFPEPVLRLRRSYDSGLLRVAHRWLL